MIVLPVVPAAADEETDELAADDEVGRGRNAAQHMKHGRHGRTPRVGRQVLVVIGRVGEGNGLGRAAMALKTA